MAVKERENLKSAYLDLIKNQGAQKFLLCVHRSAMRAMCFTGRKKFANHFNFKLIQSNIVISLAINDDDSKISGSTIACATDAARTAGSVNRARGWAAADAALIAANVALDYFGNTNLLKDSEAYQDNFAGFAAHAVKITADSTDSSDLYRKADWAVSEATGIARETVDADSDEAAAAKEESRLAEIFAIRVAAEAERDTEIGIEVLYRSCIHDILNERIQDLFECTLWAPGYEPHGKELEGKLCSALKQAGMDFVAEDLSNLFNGRQALDRVRNYRLNLSDVITQDTELLKRAIVLGEDTEPSQSVRVLLLGSGGAGKSELGDRLKGKIYRGNIQSATLGVTIESDSVVDLVSYLSLENKELSEKSSSLTTSIWDFGGQKLFHGLHSAFMHENCVYILVVDSRHEQAVDYWLHQVQHIAGRQASVIIVTNEYENCEAKQNETRLIRQFPGMVKKESFHYFSCIETINHKFAEYLVEACLDSRKRIFSTTIKVIEKLKDKYKSRRFLYKSDIEELISDVLGGHEHIDESIHNQLSQLGKTVYLKGSDDKVCLNPDWLIESAYTLINSKYMKSKRGKLSVSDIHRNKTSIFCDNKIKNSDITQLLRYIEGVGQCTVFDDFYLFPDATGSNEPADQSLYTSNMSALDIMFDLPYIPIGLHASFVNYLHGKGTMSIDPNLIWREGFVLNGLCGQQHQVQIATIMYEMRNGMIHVHTLHPDLKQISKALVGIKEFLKESLELNNSKSTVIPYISFDGSMQSVNWHDFVGLLNQNHQTVNSMLKNHLHITGDINMGDKNIIKNNSLGGGILVGGRDNTYNQSANSSISDEDKEILLLIVRKYLSSSDQLQPDELSVVAEVNAALAENDQTKLSVFWSFLQNVSGFAANTATAAQFALDYKVPVMGALITAASMLSS